MTNWDDIKKQVHEAEEPLSDNAWSGMEQMLDADVPKARYRALWIALAAVGVVVLFFGFFTYLGGDNVNKIEKIGEGEKVGGRESETNFTQEGESEDLLKSKGENDNELEIEATPLLGKETLVVDDNLKIYETSKTSKTSITENYTKAEKQELSKAKPSSQSISSVEANNTNNGIVNNQNKQTTVTNNDLKIERIKLIPAKPIGLPHQPWSSPLPNVFGVGSPVLANISTSNTTSFNYRWEIRAFAMVTYNLAPKDYLTESPTTHIDYDNATKNAVAPGGGFDAGIELKYRIFKHFKIGGGIEYRKLSNSVNYQYETTKIPLLDSASGHIINYIERDSSAKFSFSGNNTYTFISIPISVYYEFPMRGKWSLGVEGIYNHSFLVLQKSIGVNPTTLMLDEQSDEAYRSSLGSAQLRISLMYQLTENLYLAAEPSYRQYLNSFNQSENVNWAPRDLSISLSMIYRFNNLK